MTTPDDPSQRDDAPEATADEAEAEDRAAILRRRAVFIASAIAGLGMASSCADPRPCLDIAVPVEPPPDTTATATTTTTGEPPSPTATSTTEPPDAGADAEPAPCLKVAPPQTPPDAGADGGGPRPRPCLKVAPPRPCLDMVVPDNDPDKP